MKKNTKRKCWLDSGQPTFMCAIKCKLSSTHYFISNVSAWFNFQLEKYTDVTHFLYNKVNKNVFSYLIQKKTEKKKPVCKEMPNRTSTVLFCPLPGGLPLLWAIQATLWCPDAGCALGCLTFFWFPPSPETRLSVCLSQRSLPSLLANVSPLYK